MLSLPWRFALAKYKTRDKGLFFHLASKAITLANLHVENATGIEVNAVSTAILPDVPIRRDMCYFLLTKRVLKTKSPISRVGVSHMYDGFGEHREVKAGQVCGAEGKTTDLNTNEK